MIKITISDGKSERLIIERLKNRIDKVDSAITETVQGIINEVKSRGDAALREFTQKFDRVALNSFEVEKDKIYKALDKCDKSFIDALKRAAENIRDYHARQVRQSWISAEKGGIVVGQQIRPIERVGIYVPGGTAAYPSSVLMNAIPAKIAGVKEVIMVTPPAQGETANADILAAATIAGVDRIFLVGGAQAVAALAYGTESIPKVDKIVGPGNIYVTVAKKLLYGQVDIDMIAGPSEILIIADQTAPPEFIAADLMSQAEHDVLASSILLTTSLETAQQTARQIEKQLEDMPRSSIIKRSFEDYGVIIVCNSINEAIDFANELAPEHLQIMLPNPFEYLGAIKNAGSIFLGNYSPEPLGDYYAGPNHVLPTGGTARFFSPLSVDSFVKKSGFVYYTKEALSDAREDIIKLAQTEGLYAHANSIKVRF